MLTSPPLTRSIRRNGIKSLAEQAYEALEEKFVMLELIPGEIYTEAHLSEMVGLGRTPVRDAILRLEYDQLLSVIPRQGITIIPLDFERDLLAIVDAALADYRGDPDRVYLTGLSYGGYGAWYMATHYPERWAAVAPMCGAGELSKVHQIGRTPVWLFQGGRDDLVLPEWSLAPVVDSLIALRSTWVDEQGTQTSTRGGLLSFCSVSIRDGDVFRCRPEQGFGLCRHQAQQDSPQPLAPSPSIASPILLRDHGYPLLGVRTIASFLGQKAVIDAVLALRGFGTTDVAGALAATQQQLAASSAQRKQQPWAVSSASSPSTWRRPSPSPVRRVRTCRTRSSEPETSSASWRPRGTR